MVSLFIQAAVIVDRADVRRNELINNTPSFDCMLVLSVSKLEVGF